MTKFETIGVNYQYEAKNIAEANKAFKHSCDCCCNKGMQLSCDRCSIAVTHKLVVATFNDIEGRYNNAS